VYFFFNESETPQATQATLRGRGRVEVWDAKTGSIEFLSGITPGEGQVKVPLALGGGEARIVVITPLAPVVARKH
jgi:hypothetical protein